MSSWRAPFSAPPFVVWRRVGPSKESQYQIVPHAVFKHLFLHALAQWLSFFVVIRLFSQSLPQINSFSPLGNPVGRWFLTLPFFVGAAFAAGTLVKWEINRRSEQPLKILLLLAPAEDRQRFESALPTVTSAGTDLWPGAKAAQWLLNSIQVQEGMYWLGKLLVPKEHRNLFVRIRKRLFSLAPNASGRFEDAADTNDIIALYRRFFERSPPRKWHHAIEASSGLFILMIMTSLKAHWNQMRRPRSKMLRCHYNHAASSERQTNRAKLRALELRQEDSCLHALSAFAVVNCFVPIHRPHARSKARHIDFLLGYFSPIAFGFVICMSVLAIYPFLDPGDPKDIVVRLPFIVLNIPGSRDSVSKAPFLLCVTVWSAMSVYYTFATLRHDFAAEFENYFHRRPFPRSMTEFANKQMRAVPDLAERARSKWLPTIVLSIVFVLAALYATFLQDFP